jgi:hypothetical protein
MGLVLAFGSTEIVMIMACLWLAPRGAFALETLLDLMRALAAGAATLAVFWWFPPVTPCLRLPASILVFAFFSLATGLFRWGRSLASWHVCGVALKSSSTFALRCDLSSRSTNR